MRASSSALSFFHSRKAPFPKSSPLSSCHLRTHLACAFPEGSTTTLTESICSIFLGDIGDACNGATKWVTQHHCGFRKFITSQPDIILDNVILSLVRHTLNRRVRLKEKIVRFQICDGIIRYKPELRISIYHVLLTLILIK